MKGVYILLLALLSISASALTVENTSHTQSSSTNLVAIIIPLSSLEASDTSHYASDGFIVRVTSPLTTLTIGETEHKAHSATFILNLNHTDLRLVSNTSQLYTDFIESINSSSRIIVGKNSLDDYILDKYDAGLDGFVKLHDRIGVYPFDAVIISDNSIIFVYGNSIEGEIAGLRYLKSHIDEFQYMDNTIFLEDIDGLSVYDYMHLVENQKWFLTDTNKFRSIVKTALFGKINESVIDIKTDEGVLLRVFEVKPLNSKKMNDYRSNDSTPIVFAGGLWSNIESWKNLGEKLSDEGRNVYLIEITGGPGQDCSECINYDYEQLINSFWPAMISYVQAKNNNSQIIYVGHSNGARTGVSSLEIYNNVGKENAGSYHNGTDWIISSMTPNPVKTYIAVGMPGAFDGEQSYFGKRMTESGEDIIFDLNSKNIFHTEFWDVFDSYFGFTLPHEETDKISLNLLNNYFSWIISTDDYQPVVTNISKLVIITGTRFKTNDGIVTITDNDILFNESNADITHQYYVYTMHTGMGDDGQVQQILKNELNNDELTNFKKMQYSYKEK